AFSICNKQVIGVIFLSTPPSCKLWSEKHYRFLDHFQIHHSCKSQPWAHSKFCAILHSLHLLRGPAHCSDRGKKRSIMRLLKHFLLISEKLLYLKLFLQYQNLEAW